MCLEANNKISVVIPVYNAERYLSETINSVLSQTYSNLELILVNDGSTDSSLDICRSYEKDPRVVIIDKENGGVSSARYEGLLHATGYWTAFIDDDDLVAPDMYEYLTHIAERESCDIACIGRIDLSDVQIENYQFTNDNEILTLCSGKEAVDNFTKPNLSYNLMLPFWGRIYRTDFLRTVDFLKYQEVCPTIFMEDILAMPMVLYRAQRIAYSSLVKYIHREVQSSISRSGRLSSFHFEQIASGNIVLDFYRTNGFPENYHGALIGYSDILLRCFYYLSTNYTLRQKYGKWLADIDQFVKKYDREFLNNLKGSRLFNYRLFRINRKAWAYTAGNFYFTVITGYKRKKREAALR